MTFSIVARDSKTGALGVATATAGPFVGALVPHGAADAGAIATQAMTNPYLALDGLALLRTMPAQAAMDAALARDPEAQRRQFIVVDRQGAVACWTGSECNPFAGHLTNDGVAVAGNMIAGAGVLEAMLESYGGDASFEQRLLAALLAGEQAGGDTRGTGSAALKVYREDAVAAVDLRIDWSEAALSALSDLLDRATSGPYASFFNDVPRRHA